MHIYYCSFYSSRQNVSACANHAANAECCKQEGLEINATVRLATAIAAELGASSLLMVQKSDRKVMSPD